MVNSVNIFLERLAPWKMQFEFQKKFMMAEK